jgi:dihydrofolate reductase
MGTITAHEFISLDGVVEEPKWTFDFGFDPKMGETLAAIISGCTAILLGRKTYEMFAPAWSPRTAEDDPGAPFFNDSPKHIVSSTLTDPDWSNSSVLGKYDADTIRQLKNDTDGGIYISGSVTLVRDLIRDGLLDELHLFVYPVALGSGLRLFDDGLAARLRLATSEAYDNGVVHLGYAPVAS